MSEMKKCPNCGKEILAVAKKCKYCGTWIVPKYEFRCPVCCEIIPEDSVICPVCHERLKPDPEPNMTEESVHEAENLEKKVEMVSEGAQDIPTTSTRSSGRKWIFIALAGILVLGLASFFLMRDKLSNKMCYQDAKALHEWFFDNVGTHVESISSPELKARLTKLVGKKAVEGIEGILASSSDIPYPNVGIGHDDLGADMYSLIGVSHSRKNSDTFIVKYVDYGESGFFEVNTMINGINKSGKESLKQPYMVFPIVREWNYSGFIRDGRHVDSINMTLWVDGPGVEGNAVKGFYQSSGENKNYYLKGDIIDETMTLEVRDESWFPPSFELTLNKSLDQTTNLNGEMIFNSGPDAGGFSYLQVSLLRKKNSGQGAKGLNITTLNYKGKIYDLEKSYDIEMILQIENEGRWNDSVTGSYRYMSQPEDNRIAISGTIDSEKGVVLFLDLSSENETECFSFTFTDDLVDLDNLEGDWVKLKDGQPTKEMKVSIFRSQ